MISYVIDIAIRFYINEGVQLGRARSHNTRWRKAI